MSVYEEFNFKNCLVTSIWYILTCHQSIILPVLVSNYIHVDSLKPHNHLVSSTILNWVVTQLVLVRSFPRQSNSRVKEIRGLLAAITMKHMGNWQRLAMRWRWQRCSPHHLLQHGHSWLHHYHHTWEQFQPKPFQDFLWQRTGFQRGTQHHWTPGYCTWQAQEHQHQALLLLLWYLCHHCWQWWTLQQHKGVLQHQHGCKIPCIKEKKNMSGNCQHHKIIITVK